MRRSHRSSLGIIITLTLCLGGCDSGGGSAVDPDSVPGEEVAADVSGGDLRGEDVSDEDLLAPDSQEIVQDIPADEVPQPDCLEDADCDDGDLCNGVEYCLDQVCIPGSPVDCGAPGPCAEVACVPETGQCVLSPLEAGLDCDDGMVCNGLAACDGAGACAPGDAVVCEGAEACVEADGACACLAPNWMEGDGCVGPALTATFEDVDLGAAGAWVGGGEDLAVRSGNALLSNNFDHEFASWDGFAISNHVDTETPGWGNDLSPITGGGVHGSAAFAVGYHSSFALEPPTVEILDAGEAGVVVKGAYVTNTTYAYLSMLLGDDYAKKFGGEAGDEEDWFLLTVTGVGPDGADTGVVEFYLADLRAADPAEDYILDQWTWMDLTSLGPVIALRFSLSSSDIGDWGMNTPAYFAMDDMNRLEPVAAFHDLGLGAEETWDGADGSGAFQSGNLRFLNNYNSEWMTWDGFAASTMTDTVTTGFDNQFSAATGAGEGDAAYAVGFDGSGYGGPLPMVEVVGGPAVFDSVSLTNTTYGYLSMLEGDAYSKKFGGEDGTDEDWFLLTVEGLDPAGAVAGVVEFYLADLRFQGVSDDDYLLSTWDSLDLTSLGPVAALRFSLSSSDNGDFGMNTPSYFALDSVTLSPSS